MLDDGAGFRRRLVGVRDETVEPQFEDHARGGVLVEADHGAGPGRLFEQFPHHGHELAGLDLPSPGFADRAGGLLGKSPESGIGGMLVEDPGETEDNRLDRVLGFRVQRRAGALEACCALPLERLGEQRLFVGEMMVDSTLVTRAVLAICSIDVFAYPWVANRSAPISTSAS